LPDLVVPMAGDVAPRRAAIVARGSRDARSRLAFAITLLVASEELKGWS
jgi:hypothetical protein